jgi:hypothetical protein
MADAPVTLRKLSQDEAARAFPRRGQTDLSEYTEALRGLQIGESAELDLGGLSSRAVKRRLGQAATQVGYRSNGHEPAAPTICTSKCCP